MNKIKPSDEYPPEEGCYLRGNDYSPVAVVVILKFIREETPPDIELITRIAIETGAALAGTLQTENIGLEKVICNVIADPNIRYIVTCGPESPGHLTGETLKALVENGTDDKKKIIGTNVDSAQSGRQYGKGGFIVSFYHQCLISPGFTSIVTPD